MSEKLIAAISALKTCPKCDKSDYAFRARKNIPPRPDQEHGEVETKYRCRACGHEWKVRVAAG